jgi:hypothetical protein
MTTRWVVAVAAMLGAWAATAWGADSLVVGGNPALAKFSDRILFYASFDGTTDAALSPLLGACPLPAGVRPFVPGVMGQALCSGDFDLAYDLGKAARIERTGSVAIWLAARQWKPDYCYFWPFMIHGNGRQIMLGRMGDRANNCSLYAYLANNGKGVSAVAGSAADWKEGQWHLLVVNWGADWVELSIDGQPPFRAAVPVPFQEPAPDKVTAARLMVSGKQKVGDQFLMDEVMVFTSPLGADDIRWLHANVPAATTRPAGLAPTTAPAVPPSGDFRMPQVRLPLMKVAPRIDGTVDEKEWAGAARMEGFCWGSRLAPQEASFRVGCDGSDVYFAVVTQTPPGGRLLARVNPAPAGGQPPVWMDDCVELVLGGPSADAGGGRRVYRADINAKNAICQAAYRPDGAEEAWAGRWRVASRIVGDRWHLEAALPLADMKVAPQDLLKPQGIRIGRHWKQCVPPAWTEWGPMGGPASSCQTLSLVTFDPHAPVVQALQLRDAPGGDVHVVLSVSNPTDTPLDLAATIRCRPKSSAPKEEQAALALAPGQSRRVECSVAAMKEEVDIRTQVTSKDGKTIYYLRDLRTSAAAGQDIWTVDAQGARKVEMSFAYYPYHDRARVRVDVNSMPEAGKVSGVALRVVRKGGDQAIAATEMPPLKNAIATLDWPLSLPGEGEYELVAELRGVKADPIRIAFVRHVMPWEHNSLGKSDVVIPPFAPIRVEGQKIRTILREHTVGALGLWKQVQSLGKPLLTGPMRLEIVKGGQRQEVQGVDFRYTIQRETKVASEAAWSCTGLSGSARSEWDFDGMMKWTLAMSPSQEKIDAMVLVIPLDDKLIPLFHACTDGLRFNYAGQAPAGKGRL